MQRKGIRQSNTITSKTNKPISKPSKNQKTKMSIEEYIELEFVGADPQSVEFDIELVEAVREGTMLLWCGGYVIDHESDGRDYIL